MKAHQDQAFVQPDIVRDARQGCNQDPGPHCVEETDAGQGDYDGYAPSPRHFRLGENLWNCLVHVSVVER